MRLIILLFLLFLPGFSLACPSYIRIVSDDIDSSFVSIKDEVQQYFITLEDVGRYTQVSSGFVEIKIHNAKGAVISSRRLFVSASTSYTTYVYTNSGSIGMRVMQDARWNPVKGKLTGVQYNMSNKRAHLTISGSHGTKDYNLPPRSFSEFFPLRVGSYVIRNKNLLTILDGHDDSAVYDIFLIGEDQGIKIAATYLRREENNCITPKNVRYWG